jgi:ferric-dicitrate binding protein FerR (iron transport regulator)
MGRADRNDPRWNVAWDWVIRQHEQQPLTESAHAELTQWLKADPANFEHYQQAHRIWQAAALALWLATKFSSGPLVN